MAAEGPAKGLGTVRVGDAVLEMGEPADRTGIPSNGFFLFVEDVDQLVSYIGNHQESLTTPARTPRPSRLLEPKGRR